MEVTSSMSFSLWDGEDTSHTDPVTWKPRLCHSCKHLLSSVWVLEQVCTAAPNAAKSLTMACLNQNLKWKNQNRAKWIIITKQNVRRREWSKPDPTGAAGDESRRSIERPSCSSVNAASCFCHLPLFFSFFSFHSKTPLELVYSSWQSLRPLIYVI